MLQELKVEYNSILTEIQKIEDQLELTQVKMENLKATQYDKEMVSGSSRGIDINDLLEKRRYLETKLGYAKEEKGILEMQIEQLEKTFKELNDRTQLVWLQRFIKGYSITKIALLHNCSEKTIQRELKEIRSKI
jgi:DNA-directed RNA polymerase specialized sigma24 family protein